METGEREGNNAGQASGAEENVIRLPREWIGPLEDLVPIGSAADDQGAPTTPDAFWSENSSALHDAVQAPTPPPDVQAVEPPPVRRAPRRRPRPRLVLAGAAAVVVAAVAVIGTLDGPVGPPARASGEHRLAAADVPNPFHRVARQVTTQQLTTPPRDRTRIRSDRRASLRSRQPAVHVTGASGEASESALTPSTASSRASDAATTTTPTTSSATPSEPTSGSAHADGTPVTTPIQQPAFGAAGALGPGTSPDS